MIGIPWHIQILCVTVAIAGVGAYSYLKGNSDGRAIGERKIEKLIAQYKEKIFELERTNATITNTVVTEYVDRIKTIKEKEYIYVKLADNTVPSKCELSNGWVHVHDASATNGDADTTKSADATPSGVKDNQALGVVTENYSRCEQNAQQLILLQKWIVDNKDAIDKLNREKQK